MRVVTLIGAAAFCALLWGAPGAASAAIDPHISVQAETGAVTSIAPVDYVWRGRHYPYRWRGGYYPYRWRGGYYRHRRWWHHTWRYY